MPYYKDRALYVKRFLDPSVPVGHTRGLSGSPGDSSVLFRKKERSRQDFLEEFFLLQITLRGPFKRPEELEELSREFSGPAPRADLI